MDTRSNGLARRRMITPLLTALAGAALSGCVAYGPPYAVYDPAPVAAPYYYPYGYSYGYGYGYGRPAYAGPPVTLNFGYSHYDRGYRGGHGWHGGPGWGGHGWSGGRGGYHGGYHGGGHGGYHGGGRGGGNGGGNGGGRGHR